MTVEDQAFAEHRLATCNYYRLSGYWHTMRRLDPATGSSLDSFRDGATFDLVVALYDFDERLRAAVLDELAPIELAMRALIGHQLGALDPLIHLDADRLGVAARQPSKHGRGTSTHAEWLRKYDGAVRASREEFVRHHHARYDGRLPIWVAVEVMDWGLLSYLFKMAPPAARTGVAERCLLTGPQLESWLRSLNVLRNLAAHHARLFNRVFDIKPKLSTDPRLAIIGTSINRAFGQLTLVRYLGCELGLPDSGALRACHASFPDNDLVPFSRVGAPQEWREHDLWQSRPPARPS